MKWEPLVNLCLSRRHSLVADSTKSWEFVWFVATRMCFWEKTDSDAVRTCGCDFYVMISTLWRLHLAARNKQMQQCSLSSRAHISSNSYGRLYESFHNSLGSCATRLFSLRWGGFCSQGVEIGGITCCSRRCFLLPSSKGLFSTYTITLMLCSARMSESASTSSVS